MGTLDTVSILTNIACRKHHGQKHTFIVYDNPKCSTDAWYEHNHF